MPRKTTTPISDDADMIQRAAPAPKPKGKPGRPRKPRQTIPSPSAEVEAARAVAPNVRRAPRPPREMPREPSREPGRRGAVIATGRNGEVLTRRRTLVGDIHHVPVEEIPPGWDYQWNAITVNGLELREEQLHMQANGWRPVPASRHPGRWTPEGFEGAIVVKGLRLEERPRSLSMEARAEDEARAKAQVREQTDALKLTQSKLPGAKVAAGRQHLGMKMEMRIDPSLDIPEAGNYQDADDSL